MSRERMEKALSEAYALEDARHLRTLAVGPSRSESPALQPALPRRSILQDWVMDLPIREQGVLLAAVRGCDMTPKFPLDAPERKLVAFARWAFMVPADEREIDYQPGSFMSRTPPANFRPCSVGHYPLHWVMHIVHALEVLGYRHPDTLVAELCCDLYVAFCSSFHLPVESFDQMRERLSEDRISRGDVVS